MGWGEEEEEERQGAGLTKAKASPTSAHSITRGGNRRPEGFLDEDAGLAPAPTDATGIGQRPGAQDPITTGSLRDWRKGGN